MAIRKNASNRLVEQDNSDLVNIMTAQEASNYVSSSDISVTHRDESIFSSLWEFKQEMSEKISNNHLIGMYRRSGWEQRREKATKFNEVSII